jgi:hypothetical protein
MARILEFESCLAQQLPSTQALLAAANLTVHALVARVVLHGSRGLAGAYRPDSDIDLSLVINTPSGAGPADLTRVLREVTATTLDHWRGAVEVDLAAIFDVRHCGLKCFDQTIFDEHLCPAGGVDCFGLFKVQKGFNGLVENAGVRIQQMYPCLTIWRRAN